MEFNMQPENIEKVVRNDSEQNKVGERYPIMQQPTNSNQSGFQMQTQQPEFLPPLNPTISPVPPGLELFLPLDHIFVIQRVERLEAMMRIETANSYDVFGMSNQRIYFAQEINDYRTLQLYPGGTRPFVINIVDAYGRTVLIIERPKTGCGSQGSQLNIKLPNGQLFGTVVQLNSCSNKFDIMDMSGDRLMMITCPATTCADCCKLSTDYPITMISGDQIGCIKKIFAGYYKELTTDADNFVVEFPVDLDVNWKILMFGAVFLIDFLYYESNANQNSLHRNNRVGHGMLM